MENGAATLYLRSSVLGGQVVAEMSSTGAWTRGYVYLGSQVLAVQQQSAVNWMHEDPVTKSKRVTNSAGAVVSIIETDPWGADTARSNNAAFQPRKFTSYDRDQNGTDEAMFRRYNRWQSRFDQPDPYDGSYSLTNPQSFNRYAYVQNDPVNFVDPTGLYEACVHEAMTTFLAHLTGYTDQQATKLGEFAGDKPGGADSFEFAATNPINMAKGAMGRGPSANIHFASETQLASEVANFPGYIAAGNLQSAAFVLHSIQDVHGAHQGYSLPEGHAFDGTGPDRIIGDSKFLRAANETYQVLSGTMNVTLSAGQVNKLINAIIAGCGKMSDQLQITRPAPDPRGGARDVFGSVRGFGGYPSWWYSMWAFLGWVNSIPVGPMEDPRKFA